MAEILIRRPFASTGEPSGYCDYLPPQEHECCDDAHPAYTIRWLDGEFSQSCERHAVHVDRNRIEFIRTAGKGRS